MTTRSGLNYRSRTDRISETGPSQASGPKTEGAGDIQKVLQMLLDDRRKQEEEIAAELEREERETERLCRRRRSMWMRNLR